MATGAVLLCLIVGPSAGCLVTDEIMFESERNVPPVILDAADRSKAPIRSHVWIDRSAVPKMWTVAVQVRDENIDQPLVARWRVVNDTEDVYFDQLDLQPGQLLRDLSITVLTETLLLGKCARLDLVVSGSFIKSNDPRYFDLTTAGTPEDVAYARWWLWEGERGESAEAQAELLKSCPGTVDGVVAGASTQVMP